MLLKNFIAAVEQVAPLELAETWDNPGLLVGTDRKQVHSVLVALDCTTAVAQEACERDCDLILTHHPLFFQPIRRLLPNDPAVAAAFVLIKNRIGLYAAHTNLDAAQGGVNDVLASLFGLMDILPFGGGMGRIGTLQKAVKLVEFREDVNRILGARARFCGDPETVVARVAMIGGAGGSAYLEASMAGADVLLTGELKHHEALAANQIMLAVIDAGHYETENVVLLPWIRRLQEETDDVQYHIACSGVNPFTSM
ncbi:MAG: Nif3-like dinuclear metal center hexameric protein [Clostridia bacterium]